MELRPEQTVYFLSRWSMSNILAEVVTHRFRVDRPAFKCLVKYRVLWTFDTVRESVTAPCFTTAPAPMRTAFQSCLFQCRRHSALIAHHPR